MLPTDTLTITMQKQIIKLFVLLALLRANIGPLLPTASGQCVSAPSGLIGWWPGDGNANDVSGNNHNGFLKNGVSFVPGLDYSCFQFNNTNSYVDVGNLNFPITFTVETWINPRTNAYMIILAKDDGQTFTDYQRTFYLEIESGGSLVGGIRNTTKGWTQYRFTNSASPTINTGIWQHIAFTYDGNAGSGQKMKACLNGTNLVAEVVNPGVPYDNGGTPEINSISLKIGTGGDANTALGLWCQFLGMIDEVSIYSRVLSSSEIATIYSAGNTGKCKPLVITHSEANVVLTWPTNEAGYTLHSATNLVTPAWDAVSPSPVVVNGQNAVTNSISGTKKFYRLSQ